MKKKMTKLTGLNRALDLAALGAILLTTLYLLCVYPTMPSEVPGHVDFGGNVSYTEKGVVWVLVGAQAVMYAMFTLFARVPSIYENPNIPWKVKKSAKEDLARYTVMMLCVCNIECCAMFGIMGVQVANGAITGIAATGIIMSIVIIATIAALLVKMYKITKKEPWEL